MARTAGKKQAPQKFEEPDEAEGWDDAVVEADDKEVGGQLRLRDWRDVERYREMKELRRVVDDDYGLEDIFHLPMKPRTEPGIPAPRTPARSAPAPTAKPPKAGKPAPQVARPASKAAKSAPAKLKAKAKRR